MSNFKQSNLRIESLDWLRGLCALSILVYHFFSWSTTVPSTKFLLGRLGVYGVSIFFILSGLSMAIVYNQYIKSFKSSINFLLRRIFRIFPMMWLAVFGTLIIIYFEGNKIGLKHLLLNLTGLFGFIQPDSYLATGSWSLGNELVYYSLTPLILFLFNKKILYGNIICVCSWLIGLLFAFYLIPNNPGTVLAWWKIYINPFNNLFLYVSGIALFYNFRNYTNASLTYIILITSLSGLSFYFTNGQDIDIISNFTRIFFCLCSIGITYSFWKLSVNLPKTFTFPLEQLGLATYGIYLLHPLIIRPLLLLSTGFKIPIFVQLLGGGILTIVLSLVVYKYLELPFIKIGKMLTQNKRIVSS